MRQTLLKPASTQTRARHIGRDGVIHLLGAVALVAALLFSMGAQARSAPDSFADLAEKLLPAVVNISTTQQIAGQTQGEAPRLPPGTPFEDLFRDFFDRQQRNGNRPHKVTSLGSGFIIDKSGVVITNNHVIEEADEITVFMGNGDKYPAVLVGRDPKTDIAVLRIEPGTDLPTVSFGDSDASRVGDWVMAIGNPFGLGGTVTAGIISAQGRDIRQGPYDNFIQTDASINRGNSGGPLFNMDGEVIGINTAIFSQTGGSVGIGFAVPSSIARTVIDQILTFGRTKRGWLGVRIQRMTEELADGFGLGHAEGALVSGVTDGGPAADADIRAGDVILSFDGKPVREMRELPLLVAETPVGKVVDVEIWRQGKKLTVGVKLGELEEAEQSAALSPGGPAADNGERKIDKLGFRIAPLDDEMRQRFNVAEDANGVVIVDVDPNSEAAEKGVRPGDIIVEVQQEPVSTTKGVTDRLSEIEKEKRKNVLLLLQNGGELRFIAIGIGEG
ncbi:DegQ family serine endoprotease [Oceanibacterium hippocampi]|uniref:Probable periplasmic serine endoprotease DegP-like n=1 Tax=Oceanibacterium hippocampi TaxID=745714 RepID=A0A1Y5TZT0_9PROT|nr:DegQ family serine endoprotease [Oceanibacterium hippocampi]SLN72432.1 putative periplasmic serine endoprotease DegP-like precursor [Oceanibacterium hippocampi]